MKDKIPQREIRPFDQADIDIAAKLVDRELGNNFDIEYGEMPRNVGNMGDEGVRGDTVMITSDSERPVVSFTERYSKLGYVATQICNETTATKVLIDLTPPDATATFITEDDNRDQSIPFIDLVKRRLEGYPLLKRQYYARLDGDPMLQTAVSAILDYRNADFRAKMARDRADFVVSIRTYSNR